MGAVYLGVHPGIGSRVAVKVLSMAAAESRDTLERFFAEARAVNVIRHESIVNVLDLSTLPDGRPYIVMEHLEGAVLARHFETTRPFPVPSLVRLALEVLGALGAAHAVGITHRDLKPDNIFVTTLGRAKVLDFGIAKLRPGQGGQSDATRTGALLGTPHYMSPEQALGREVDQRADIYSLGVILFEGATGCRPFDADSLFELLRMHVERPPPAPRSLRPELLPTLEAVILRALSKEASARFQSAGELAAALASISRQLPEPEALAPPAAPALVPAPALAPTAASDSYSSAASAGGVSSTLGKAGAPGEARSNVGLIVGIAGTLVALVALAVAGVALFVSSDMLGARGSGSAAERKAPKRGGGFDATGELDAMRAKARQHFPDAELAVISATGVEADGTVDLKVQNHAVAYVFRSPSASKSSDKCVVSVSTSMYGTFAAPYSDTTDPKCSQPVIHAPSCSIRQVTEGLPAGMKPASIAFSNQQGAFRWVIVLEGGSIHIKQDDC